MTGRGCGPEWDDVLRALVYDAYGKQGTDEFDAALRAIVDADVEWPLAEMLFYLDQAREIITAEETARAAEELAWYETVFESIERGKRSRSEVRQLVAA
jgi:hypothetical protein